MNCTTSEACSTTAARILSSLRSRSSTATASPGSTCPGYNAPERALGVLGQVTAADTCVFVFAGQVGRNGHCAYWSPRLSARLHRVPSDHGPVSVLVVDGCLRRRDAPTRVGVPRPRVSPTSAVAACTVPSLRGVRRVGRHRDCARPLVVLVRLHHWMAHS